LESNGPSENLSLPPVVVFSRLGSCSPPVLTAGRNRWQTGQSLLQISLKTKTHQNSMKAKITTEPKPAFKPVTIEITFETKKQLDAFGTMCNYSPVCDAIESLCGDDFNSLRNALEAAGAKIDNTVEFGKLVEAHPAITPR
jgi:hypothetical protein